MIPRDARICMVADRGVVPMYNLRGSEDILAMEKRIIKGKGPQNATIERSRVNFDNLDEDRVVI